MATDRSRMLPSSAPVETAELGETRIFDEEKGEFVGPNGETLATDGVSAAPRETNEDEWIIYEENGEFVGPNGATLPNGDDGANGLAETANGAKTNGHASNGIISDEVWARIEIEQDEDQDDILFVYDEDEEVRSHFIKKEETGSGDALRP